MAVELRDYQRKAALFLFVKQRGFVIAPAGSGKTMLAAEAAAWWACARGAHLKRKLKIFWLANTIEQVEQAEAALRLAECSADVTIEVCCVASLPDLSEADLVIVDEAHHMPAETWVATLARIPGGCALWGLSATPWSESDPLRNELVKLTFREFFQIERGLVEASGHLIKGQVEMYDLDTWGMYDAAIEARTQILLTVRMKRMPWLPRFEQERRIKWQVTQEAMQENSTRNCAAVWLANSEAAKGESVLMLVGSIEHGERLVEGMPCASIVHSKLTKKLRRERIENLRTGVSKILVATSLADEGLDVPRASRLVLVAGGRSAGKLEQRAGRVLRPFEGKNGGKIYDFLDRGATFAHAQAKARLKVYEALGYNPEIKTLAS